MDVYNSETEFWWFCNNSYWESNKTWNDEWLVYVWFEYALEVDKTIRKWREIAKTRLDWGNV